MPSLNVLTGLPEIPAMTKPEERECYYRHAKEAAGKGAVIEFGAWMGASTAYIAAGIRDSGVETKVHVYDKFESKPGHVRKVKEFYYKRGLDKAPVGPCLLAFQQNLGPLMEYVEPHPGQIENLKWDDRPIALLVTDAPKRVPAISSVLTKLRKSFQPGAIMAWQDFCHFPSYEIAASLYRIRHHIEFVEAVFPGTTLVFRVKSQWEADEVSLAALSKSKWTPQEIAEAWAYWGNFIAPENKHLFDCGAAMFLCDTGHQQQAIEWLDGVDLSGEVIKKWRYLRDGRPDFLTRYAPLFDYLKEAA